MGQQVNEQSNKIHSIHVHFHQFPLFDEESRFIISHFFPLTKLAFSASREFICTHYAKSVYFDSVIFGRSLFLFPFCSFARADLGEGGAEIPRRHSGSI